MVDQAEDLRKIMEQNNYSGNTGKKNQGHCNLKWKRRSWKNKHFN